MQQHRDAVRAKRMEQSDGNWEMKMKSKSLFRLSSLLIAPK